MKTTPLLTLVSSLLFASVCYASDTHDMDKGVESSLRATLNDKHVHVHVKHGIVKLDGQVRTVEERDRIDSLVRHTPGVVALKDELKVTSLSPGVYSDFPSGVPVYTTAAPEIIPGAPVVTTPAPVIVPEFPKLKVQAFTSDDEPLAQRVARHLRSEALPASEFDNVNILVRNGNLSVDGIVETPAAHDALITSLQRTSGARAIYDQLRIR